MAKYKQKYLNHFAKTFGMTVSELCASIGYTRQAIYMNFNGLTKMRTGSLRLVRHELESLNKRILASAQEEFEFRNKMIDEFMERLKNGGDDDA